jgi:hypothetical protein
MTDLNPNTIASQPPVEGNTNRGKDVAGEFNSPEPITITLEKINETIMEFLTTTLAPTIEENGAVRRVPVVYGTPERWVSVRKDGFLRDTNTTKILTPLIMIRRTEERPGTLINPNNKYVYKTLEQTWNPRIAYDKFSVLNKIRPHPRIRTVLVPDYMDLTYEMILWADGQTQLDKLIEQLNVESQEYWGHRGTYKFRTTITQFSSQSELPPTSDRVVRSQANIEIKAYLLPEKALENFKIVTTNKDTFAAKKMVTMIETVTKLPNL